MKRIILLIGLAIGIVNAGQSQWVSNYGGNTTGDNRVTNAKGIADVVNSLGDCYVTGYTYDDFSGNDIVLIKYNYQGDTVWARTYNGSGNADDRGNAITLDAAGNVYVTGYASVYGHGLDIVTLKYTPDGNQQWAMIYNGSGNSEDKAFGIAVDAVGNIYVTGYTTSSGSNINTVTIKYSTSGAQLWAKLYNGHDNQTDKAFGIAVDAVSNVYVTGYTESENSEEDIIVLKYNSSSGQLVWSRTYDGPKHRDDEATCIATDASGNIYAAGFVTAKNGNNTNCVLLKYNSSGSLVWDRTYNDGGSSLDKAFGIAVDPTAGSIYITGMAGDHNSDYITIKYNPNGGRQWVSSYDGTGHGDDVANSIALLASGNVVITGKSWGVNNNDDFATVKYNAQNGHEQQVWRYSFALNSEDIATDVATSLSGGSIYVTGYSELVIDAQVTSSVISTTMIQTGGETIEITNTEIVPENYALYQNYPNPFNPSTLIKYDIVKSSNVKLAVYDIAGREVATLVDGFVNAGKYEAVFTSNNLSSGVYFYLLTAGDFRDVKKMTLVK
jgi:uncharacterized delta-60 repeat protein